jgi:hypothetical protein
MVPLNGDGAYGSTSNMLCNGNKMMKDDLQDHVNLLTRWTKVSTKLCKKFAQWYNGNNAIKLSNEFKSDETKRKVVTLNCCATNNFGIVRHYRVQLRILNQLVLHILKNHLTTFFYKSFLVHQHKFSFIDKKTGNTNLSGLILMHEMLDVCKPEPIVEVHHLKKTRHNHPLAHLQEQRTPPHHEDDDDSPRDSRRTGSTTYTDQRFITNLFLALESYHTKKFLAFIDQLKSQWIMEDISKPADIILKVDKTHRNMVADSSWLNPNEKDAKIVALTSAIQEVNLAKKVSFDGSVKVGSSGKKGNAKSSNSKQLTKTHWTEWQ